MSEKSDRRNFIKSATAGAVAAGLTLRGASASARILGANDRIVAGFIGTGRMGEGNLKDFIKQSNVDAAIVCDVYAPNLEKAGVIAPRAAKVTDFRRLLDRKEIDVVVIATPDHWHALPMVMACQAGKDVYVEKPISLTIDEGRKMVEAARKYSRVVQVGTQQRSGIHFQKAVEIIRSGRSARSVLCEPGTSAINIHPASAVRRTAIRHRALIGICGSVQLLRCRLTQIDSAYSRSAGRVSAGSGTTPAEWSPTGAYT